MKVLVTCGSTWVKIDEVRILANVFTGNTGVKIAKYFANEGAEVTLAYNPKIKELDENGIRLVPFVTFDDLMRVMESEITNGGYDVVIHSAAVSDYGKEVTQLVEVDPSALGITLPEGLRLYREVIDLPGKIKSDLPEMVIRMTKTDKIIDFVKTWDQNVFAVKFKLEVGRDQKDLVDVAKNSMKQSNADMMVANDLKGARNGLPSAIVIAENGEMTDVQKRSDLASVLYSRVRWYLDTGGKR